MQTYTFVLIVEGADLQTDSVLDALFKAGCDDGLVGATDRVQYVEFDREAPSLAEAILSAVADVESVPDLTVSRIADAGLISMSAIAARTGRTRESVRLLIAGDRGPGGFPSPVTDPRSKWRLWRSDEVDDWFRTGLGESVENVADDRVRAAINAGLELRRHWDSVSGRSQDDLRTLVGL